KRPSHSAAMPSASATWSSDSSKSTSALLRESEHPLADDVALDLRRARRDRQRQGVDPVAHEVLVGEVAQVARGEAHPVQEAMGEGAHPLAHLAVVQLEHRSAGTDQARALGLRDVAPGERPQGFVLRLEAADLTADLGVLPRGGPAAGDL